MANGANGVTFRRYAAAVLAAIGMGGNAHARVVVEGNWPRRNEHHADRLDVDLGKWSYARKGKRTAAQRKRAARKKRNRARHK